MSVACICVYLRVCPPRRQDCFQEGRNETQITSSRRKLITQDKQQLAVVTRADDRRQATGGFCALSVSTLAPRG